MSTMNVSFRVDPTSALGQAIMRLQARQTSRVCSREGCEKAAAYIDGYYLVGNRRVRVWVCMEHRVGSSITLLPTPESILAAEEAEKQHLERMRKRYTLGVAPEKSVSVKTLAPAGHGDPIRGDRVKNWRWNGW